MKKAPEALIFNDFRDFLFAAVKRLFGGDNRTRICDLSRVRRALYRLSYASISGWLMGWVVTRTGLEPVLPP